MNLNLDMYMTAGVGVVALLLGMCFTKWIPFLKRFCIPVPVSGGLLISLFFLLLYSVFGLDINFDGTIKDIAMTIFFTSVGYQSNLRVLKQGGKPLVVMIILVAVLIISQNLLSLGIAKGMGVSSLVGMATGSIPMCGGHGTAGGFSPLLEKMGLEGADSITMAAATFGLIAGSLIGGPLGEMLIRRHKLAEEIHTNDEIMTLEASEGASSLKRYTQALGQLFVAMALGMGLSKLIAMTGITVPTYFGSLVVAAILRNVFGHKENELCLKETIGIGELSLSIFLGIAMSTLKLWELAGLMLPLFVILVSQGLFMGLYAAFVAFPAFGRNYDAAMLVSGLCGFGLGATPNAMANMSAVSYKYHYSVKPFIIVPVVGAMFVDIINTGVITFFLNLL
jgi:ESS family glutamate:Na+ symporter